MSDSNFNAETERSRDAEGQTASAPPQLGNSAFKETEIGLIPVEWAVVKLGKVSTITLGQSPPSSTYNTEGVGLPFLQGKAEFGEVYPAADRWCSEPQRVASPGSVLISVRAPVGDVNVAQYEYCIGRGLTAIDDTEVTDNWFLFYLLRHAKSRLEEQATGSTFKSINKGILTNFLVPLPPLPEQRRIAEALRTIQEAIAAQEDVIAATRELKRSLMERLFTYGPGPEPAPTKETSFGSVPASWDIQVLDECAYIQTGAAKGRRLDDAETINVPYLRVANVQDGYLDLEEIKYIRIRESERERYSLQPGDVVLTEGGDFDKLGRGFVWQNQVPNCVHQNHIFAVRVNQKVLSPEYLGYLVQSEYAKAYFLSVAHRTTNLACINKTKLAAFPVLIPSLEVQTDIAARLQTADAKIAAEEQRKAALESVFQSALEQLMTGRTRLPAA